MVRAHVFGETKDQPLIWASPATLPLSIHDAEVKSCNQKYCAAPSIQLKLANDTTYGYYVGVEAVTNGTIGVWINSECSPECDAHGTCSDDKETEGICECILVYTGVGCTERAKHMLAAQYIVLIVIATLVVTSALIGFISFVRQSLPSRALSIPSLTHRFTCEESRELKVTRRLSK
eukprot:TRINITY_DN177_c0_g3_i1.p1 TRINITY_DN177_c0_g3~~TRINITY_DN177_c0_g3_i1.p1  ORF type:complete len:177 (+),score=23.06 TRINITY_DN177_c0_g3_i1:227-757(+)